MSIGAVRPPGVGSTRITCEVVCESDSNNQAVWISKIQEVIQMLGESIPSKSSQWIEVALGEGHFPDLRDAVQEPFPLEPDFTKRCSIYRQVEEVTGESSVVIDRSYQENLVRKERLKSSKRPPTPLNTLLDIGIPFQI